MRKLGLLMSAVILLLTGCMGEPYKAAHMARGEAERANDLEKTDVFTPTENLKVVINFNQHSQDLNLRLNWSRLSEGNRYDDMGNLDLLVPSDAESALIEYDLAQAGRPYWEPGEWKVDIRINEELVETLAFKVEGEIPEVESGEETDDGDEEFDVDNPSNPFGD